MVLIEAGVRVHTSEYTRDRSDVPSPFTLKLRRHLRTKRLEDVRQLGIDRVLDFCFGFGANSFHLIVELFAAGNLILTDSAYSILALLRSHKHNEHVPFAVGDTVWCSLIFTFAQFPLDGVRPHEPITHAVLATALESLIAPAKTERRGKQRMIKAGLADALNAAPVLVEHCLVAAHINPDGIIPEAAAALLKDGLEELKSQFAILNDLQGRPEGEPTTGFLFLRKRAEPRKLVEGESSVVPLDQDVVDFAPIRLAQYASLETLCLPAFERAVDEAFTHIERGKETAQRQQQKTAAEKKVEKVKEAQAAHISSLRLAQEVDEVKAQLIEMQLEQVDAVIDAMRQMLATGVDWTELWRLVKEEQHKGSPVAGLIHSLNLQENKVAILLSRPFDDLDEDEMTSPAVKIDIDLGESAYANASRYYTRRKAHAVKEAKTSEAAKIAIRKAEKKAQKQVSQVQAKATIRQSRRALWFEKFNWFITSENYIVISGRDAQQNELIVKRYLTPNDVYLHADLHGAASTVMKNPNAGQSVAPLSLIQAGMMTVCRSGAWSAKVVSSAWWVWGSQVSKTAPTGEYLTTGSFMIRGKKNYLPPSQLIMGFGFLFKLDDSSIGKHLNERRVRGAEGDSIVVAPPVEEDELSDEFSNEEEAPRSSTFQSSVPDEVDEGADRHRYITAAERRRVKRGKTWSAGDDQVVEKKVSVEEKKPKGRRRDKKKKDKYADQDEEERAVAMAVLGHTRAVQGPDLMMDKKSKRHARKEKREAAKSMRDALVRGVLPDELAAEEDAEQEAEVVVVEEKTGGAAAVCYHCGQTGHISWTCPDRAGMSRSAAKRQDEAEVKQILEEEGIVPVDDDEERLSVLNTLTAKPDADDVVLHAIPVCAPWEAMKEFSYKVKMTPSTGHSKKGATIKAAMNVVTSGKIPDRHVELMRCVPDSEIQAAVLSNAHVQAVAKSGKK